MNFPGLIFPIRPKKKNYQESKKSWNKTENNKSRDYEPLRVVEKNKEVVNVIDENGNLKELDNYSYSKVEK